MRLVKLGMVLMILLFLPIPAVADEVYPMLSYNTFIDSDQERSVFTHIERTLSQNYTIICRNNGTNVNLTLDYFNTDILESRYTFYISNFTIFSFKLNANISHFDIRALNNGNEQIKIYVDLYTQSLDGLQGDTLILFPIDNPVIEYVTVIEYIPIMIPYNVTSYVTIYEEVTKTQIVEHTHTEYLIDIGPAILVAIGGISILFVYIAARIKQEQNKPINKMSLDELFDEFRKGN